MIVITLDTGAGDYRHQYAFDLSGNRRRKTVDVGDDGNVEQTTRATYNNRDQLTAETSNLPPENSPFVGRLTLLDGSPQYVFDIEGGDNGATNGFARGVVRDQLRRRR